MGGQKKTPPLVDRKATTPGGGSLSQLSSRGPFFFPPRLCPHVLGHIPSLELPRSSDSQRAYLKNRDEFFQSAPGSVTYPLITIKQTKPPGASTKNVDARAVASVLKISLAVPVDSRDDPSHVLLPVVHLSIARGEVFI